MRVYKLKKAGFDLGQSVNSVVLNRYVAYMGLMVLVVVGQPWPLPMMGDGPLAWGVPIALGLGLLAVVAVPTIDLVPLPQRLRKMSIVKGIEEFAGGARRILKTLRIILPTLAIAVAGHTAIASTAFLLAAAIGLSVSYGQILVLFPPVFLVGVEPAGALAFSVLFGVVTALSSLPGGVIWLLSKNKTGEDQSGSGRTQSTRSSIRTGEGQPIDPS